MSIKVKLNQYEQGIVQSLEHDFGFTAVEAYRMTVQFLPVVRKLGGYENSRDHAERIAAAVRNGYRPEAWLERIQALDKEFLADKGLPVENGFGFVDIR